MSPTDPGAADGSSFAIADDAGVPVVVMSRLRLLDRFARHYDLYAALLVDEDCDPRLKFTALIRNDDSSISIPFPILRAEDFNEGLKALYMLLQPLSPGNQKTWIEMICSDSVKDPVALSHSGPIEG